ncbi:MAG TPA: hypothetical protein VNJ54_08160 [Plantibacter sp.]|uniref:hypothetical protein n=1 Tax=unclassified Plantibacter TaxID=2624265 RepID=UPI002B6A8753|nr:hypothetical protein [Plantibacter sp.]
MSIDPLVSLLVGALGAATLGLVGGAIGAWVQSRREHRRWLREQKMHAYTAVLDLVQRISLESSPVREGLNEEVTDLYRATATVELLGPDTLAGHTRMLRDAVGALVYHQHADAFPSPDLFLEDSDLTSVAEADSADFMTNLLRVKSLREIVIKDARKELDIRGSSR